MGRKPNTLILEYFDRGEKLQDNSNRYQHTCKNCGEVFAKGRSESLIKHVLEKCPNVTPFDRTKVHYAQQNGSQLPKATHANSSAPSNSNVAAFNDFQTSQPDLVDYELPIPPFYPQRDQQMQFYPPGQSALETLAEVSRQHLDYSAQRPHYDPNGYGQGQGQSMLEADHGADHGADRSTDYALLSQLQQHATAGEQSQQAFANAVLASGALTSSPLVQTASAANHHLEQEQEQEQADDHNQAAHLDPSLIGHGVGMHFDMPVPPPSQAQGSNMFTWQQDGAASKPVQSFGSLTVDMPSNEPNPGLSLAQDNSNKKGRSRFEDNRRKEVQSIRKQGACIRCRMLKKSCSPGQPCNTCSSVEAARLWKGQCIRTRLVDEFALYSTSLFFTKAQMEILASINGLRNEILPGQIEAKPFNTADHSMMFNIRRYTAQEHSPSIETILLIQESELLEGGTGHDKFERYFHAATEACVETDPSPFFKATLQQTLDLSQQDRGGGLSTRDKNATRASYNLQDKRLDDNIISLCVATSFLSHFNDSSLQLFYQPAPMVRQNASTGNLEDHHIEKIAIDQNTASYGLIRLQLLATTESLCSKLCKSIMNELERRLLQRQQAAAFATLTTSTLLLNCVERMCELYTRLGEPSVVPVRDSEAGDDEAQPTSAPRDWPLVAPPSALVAQGFCFSKLLTTLLRMRALPPRTMVTPEGVLVVLQDNEMPVQHGGRATKMPDPKEVQQYVQWLNPLGLKAEELSARRAGVVGDGEAEGSGATRWDMRFVADVLLPPLAGV